MKQTPKQNTEDDPVPVADASVAVALKPEFSLDLLELTPEQRAELCNRLQSTPNAHTAADVLSALGFRNDDGSLSFIKDHIVRQVTQQDILHTFKHIFADKTEIEAAPFFAKLGSLTNASALKLIARTDSEADGQAFWHDAWTYLFPFQNGVLKIARNRGLDLVPYADLKVLVNADTILPRPVILSQETVEPDYWQQSDFYRLTLCQATDPDTGILDQNLHESIMLGLAKTCHLHFNPMDPCAVIFSEQTAPGDKNAGGTGKGILVKAISQMMGKPARIDGKSFDINYPHALQSITPHTRVVWVDEVDKTEEVLNAFYTGLTEGFVINPKNQRSFTIPAERGPRVVFTTNSPGTGVNDSDLRRRYDVPLTRWYNADRQPVKDFGRELFGPEWDDEEWNKFYLTLAMACHRYLQLGCASGKMPRCQKAQEMLKQAALNEIDPDLADHFDFCYNEKLQFGQPFDINYIEKLDQFKQAYPQNRAGITNSHTYNSQLKKWLATQGWSLDNTERRIWVTGRQCRVKIATPLHKTLPQNVALAGLHALQTPAPDEQTASAATI